MASVFLLIGIFLGYFLKARKLIKGLKERENWTLKKKQVTIVETKKEDVPFVSTTLPFIMGGLILLGNVIYVKLKYSQFPDDISYHWNIQGLVTGSIAKTPLSIFLLPGIQLFILIIMFFLSVCKAIKGSIRCGRS